MPTDEERREVARNIRENYVRGGLGYKVATAYNITMAIGMNPGVLVEDIELWNRLADLIEPGEPKVKCVAEVKIDGEQLEKLAHDIAVGLTGIDRDALLALADEFDEQAEFVARCIESSDGDFDRCAIDAMEGQYEYARRIREACGEVGHA